MLSERNVKHLCHVAVAVVVAYLLLTKVRGESSGMAEDRVLFLGAVALAYMVAFGHKLPSRAGLNRNLTTL